MDRRVVLKKDMRETILQDSAHILLIILCHLMAWAFLALSRLVGYNPTYFECLLFVTLSLACRNQVKRLWNERD